MAFEQWIAGEAAALFRAWLEGPPKRRQVDVAELFEVSQQTVSSWSRGAVPGAYHRVLIRRHAGIAPSLWLPPERRTLVELTPAEEDELIRQAAADTDPAMGDTGTDGGAR